MPPRDVRPRRGWQRPIGWAWAACAAVADIAAAAIRMASSSRLHASWSEPNGFARKEIPHNRPRPEALGPKRFKPGLIRTQSEDAGPSGFSNPRVLARGRDLLLHLHRYLSVETFHGRDQLEISD